MIGSQETPVEFLDCKSAEESQSESESESKTPVLDSSDHEKGSCTTPVDHNLLLAGKLGEKSAAMNNSKHAMEEKTLEDFLKEMDECENTTWNHNLEVKKVEPLPLGSANKSNILCKNLDYTVGSHGSMRKEREWKRTLGCKFYEERQNSSYGNGGERMDLLWETYEMQAIKKMKKKGNSKGYKKEDDNEEEDMDVKLCCLQALKLSTRKMNLGMGRRNLVKISKAFRGFGWLHHVS